MKSAVRQIQDTMYENDYIYISLKQIYGAKFESFESLSMTSYETAFMIMLWCFLFQLLSAQSLIIFFIWCRMT